MQPNELELLINAKVRNYKHLYKTNSTNNSLTV